MDKTSSSDQAQEPPAMSPAQQRFSSASSGRMRTYKEFSVGDLSWAAFSLFELNNILFSSLPGFFGIGIRSLTLPRFLSGPCSGLVVGRSVTLRQPACISIGRQVIIDDDSVLDARGVGSKIEIGDHVVIGRNSIVTAKNGKIVLGNGTNISSTCRIATESSIKIGKSVLISAYTYIGPGNHKFDDPHRPIIEQGMDPGLGISIGDNAWIGARATILDGVSIGQDAVIGAHSLVKEDVSDGAVVAGTPAKVIRQR